MVSGSGRRFFGSVRESALPIAWIPASGAPSLGWEPVVGRTPGRLPGRVSLILLTSVHQYKPATGPSAVVNVVGGVIVVNPVA